MNSESQDKIIRNKDKGNAIIRYWKSLGHAVRGIIYAAKNEHNVIIMILATITVVGVGIYFNISVAEWLFCITMIGLVLGAEMINSSLEAVVDLVTTEIHPLAKIAKDCASSASLIFSLTAFTGGLIIFLPKIIEIIIK